MPRVVEKWDYFELELPAQVSGNPFLDIEFEAEFTHVHRSVKVMGFYDGEDVYKVRFMPDMEGAWSFVTHSNLDALDGQRGEFTCTPPTGDNHGPVGVTDHYHFAYADGTPYHPVGTTCYVWNHQGDELEQQTLDTLKEELGEIGRILEASETQLAEKRKGLADQVRKVQTVEAEKQQIRSRHAALQGQVGQGNLHFCAKHQV